MYILTTTYGLYKLCIKLFTVFIQTIESLILAFIYALLIVLQFIVHLTFGIATG